MPFIGCCRYIDENIMPHVDFLHTPVNFPITKKATKSYCGILLSFVMILICIFLFINEILSIKINYSISYAQEFIHRRDWSGKKITLGFNTSEQWTDRLEFRLINSKNETINLKKCDENLIENENGPYFCILNYAIQINDESSHVLKLQMNLKNKTTYNLERIPFSLAVREPKINHDDEDNPLGLSVKSSIDKFRCFFETSEVTSYRRSIKYIKYKTSKNLIFKEDKIDEGIYLDDYEDSRKLKANEETGNLVGTYRILISKKIDVYERKYIDINELFGHMGGYISALMTIFKILTLIFVNPNDNYRIFDYIPHTEYNDFDLDLKNVYDFTKKKTIKFQDFVKLTKDKSCCKKFWNKFRYIFCRCCPCNKKTEHISIVDNYIKENLTIEKYLENQILFRKEFLN